MASFSPEQAGLVNALDVLLFLCFDTILPMRRMRWIIIFGILMLVIAPFLLWCGHVVRKERAIADRQMCASQLISLGQAILLYCNENRGYLPQSWREICVTQDVTSEVFVCPASDDVPATGDSIDARAQQLVASGHCSYQYLGSGNIRDVTPDLVLAVEKPFHHGSDFGANVLFGDGHVRHMTGAASKQILDAISRGERPVRYSGGEGQVMRKSGSVQE